MKASLLVLGTLVVLALLGFVGQMDYEDAKREEAFYCHMVAAGHWPDYEGTYASCP